jgi:hypothetical protein
MLASPNLSNTVLTFLQKLYTFRNNCSKSCKAPRIRFPPLRRRPKCPPRYVSIGVVAFWSGYQESKDGGRESRPTHKEVVAESGQEVLMSEAN